MATRKARKLTRARKHAITRGEKKAEAHYKRNRAKILRKAKAYYRKHRAQILRRAKIYRRRTRGKGPYYKTGRVGGHMPRFKRLKRLNKYSRRKGR